MSRFLEAFDSQCASTPDAIAYKNTRGESLTYRELHERSGALAARLMELDPRKAPAIVYGHKSPYMLVCLLACVRSGRAYVPVDISFPPSRVADIIDQLGGAILFETTGDGIALDEQAPCSVMPLAQIEEAAARTLPADELPGPADYVSGNDDFYIIFTSGSTGRPKGVRLGSDAVDAFWGYTLQYPVSDRVHTTFNRVPFSFDVSITDVLAGLSRGYTLFALAEEAEADLGSTLEALSKSGATVWLSTPSFADICLTSPDFNADLMPELESFEFSGETLHNSTVRKLQERFPDAMIVNAYGPTETQAVTGTAITPEMAASDEPLPIGRVKPGSEIRIVDPESLEEMPVGEAGEIFILGDTAANGYFGRPDLTEVAFADAVMRDGTPTRRYRTGDKGFLDADGMLHYRGRFDFQVKLHGYRVELGEIEKSLVALPEVVNACVLPYLRDGRISYLCACVLLADGAEGGFSTTKALKASLKETLPEYMVPRKFVYPEEFPLNTNGKVDRKLLSERYCESSPSSGKADR